MITQEQEIYLTKTLSVIAIFAPFIFLFLYENVLRPLRMKKKIGDKKIIEVIDFLRYRMPEIKNSPKGFDKKYEKLNG